MTINRLARLNPRQERFAREYMVRLNATQAAIAAGYSAKTAAQIGERLLRKVEIADFVATEQAKMAKKLDITLERIITELAKIGFANMADYVRSSANGETYIDLSDVDRDKWAAVGELVIDRYTEGNGDDAREVKRTKFKLLDKRAALVDLGKHLGLGTGTSTTKHVLVDEDETEIPLRELARRLAFALSIGLRSAEGDGGTE